MENVEPMLTNDRIEIVEPMVDMSNSDSDAPLRVKPNTENHDPNRQ
jgi:hypothetical protein